MLRITVPATEAWDEQKEEFVTISKEQTLQLEHSLVSVSKWESKWHKAFLSKREKTPEEMLDYIKCMTLTQNVDSEVYTCLTDENLFEIQSYINNPMSATIIPDDKNKKKDNETVTSELIYYWMIALNIPQEYQKWHLNRLIKLIEVCNFKNSPQKKRNLKDIMRSNTAINEARKKKLNTRG